MFAWFVKIFFNIIFSFNLGCGDGQWENRRFLHSCKIYLCLFVHLKIVRSFKLSMNPCNRLGQPLQAAQKLQVFSRVCIISKDFAAQENEWRMSIFDRDHNLGVDQSGLVCESNHPKLWSGSRAMKGVKISGKNFDLNFFEIIILRQILLRSNN